MPTCDGTNCSFACNPGYKLCRGQCIANIYCCTGEPVGPHDTRVCTCADLYSDANYGTPQFQILVGVPGQTISAGSMPSGWNDYVSSVKVMPGCSLTAYENDQYMGMSRTWGTSSEVDIPDLTTWGFNDTMSSYSCHCTY
jgi:hypothetical protein